MLLDSTSSIELVGDAGASTDLAFVAHAQTDTGTEVTGYVNQGTSNAATSVTMVAAPILGQFRRLIYASIRNAGTATRDVRVQLNAGAIRIVRDVSLAPGEALEYAGRGWRAFDAAGREKIVQPGGDQAAGEAIGIFKTGTAAEAAASWYGFAKDAGAPGAWVPGTPGLNGVAVSAPFAGALPFANPAQQKKLYIPALSMSVAGMALFYDLLWYNTGIVVTTITEQPITTPTFPARDADGTANGRGCLIGLYFTANATNVGAIANSTVRYTSSNGDSPRTATLVAVAGSQIPATPVAGTIVWFSLQAGDTGVRSIEGITLTTSLVTGAVSLFVARWIASVPVPTANIPVTTPQPSVGVTIYPSSAIFTAYLASATTALALCGTAQAVPG